MPNNQKSQSLAEFVGETIREARAAERTSSLMSTRLDVWICRKCGTRNNPQAERCAVCDRRR
jgi:ribosomal protein L40E